MITKLKPNEVFVFGSNLSGFHGAGSAGYAWRGTTINNWRDDEVFKSALHSEIGSPERIGRWAVLGEACGFQKGKEGMSYAICTIEKPGELCSVSLDAIHDQFTELFRFAEAHPTLRFLMTEVGCQHAGYTRKEMLQVWEHASTTKPDNVIVPPNFYK
jgi:hypothetical protein